VDIDFTRLRRQYSELLLDGIVPFWFRHGIDWEHGGVLSCMTEEGEVLSTDKYLWSQARSVWTFAALYNRIERRPEFLRAAENSVRFLLQHGRDAQGRWVYRTTREGGVIEGPISIFSDCFAIYGLSEYCRAVRDEHLLSIARDTFEGVRERVESPGFAEVAPQSLLPGHRPHAVPMILLEVANELAQTTGDPALELAAGEYASRILDRFVRPQRQVLVEYLDRDYQELPSPEGTYVNPGHAIESMWFVLHLARRRNDRNMIRTAVEVIRWHLERGWDPEYGGIFLGIDADGGEPFPANWDKKVWWPHTESLYALLLAHRLTGEDWCLEWYQKVHDWAFEHFAMPDTGEWRQRLDRSGNPITELIALPVKDPFHLPRAAILIVELLED
jgi:N-acylglucosamine 2-epimerase